MLSIFESYKKICSAKQGFPGGELSIKESACSAGDTGDAGSIPGLGRSPGGGHGNPFQYSCQENPMDRGVADYSSQGQKESDRTEVS